MENTKRPYFHRKFLFIFVGILALIMVGIGITYGFWMQTETQNTFNVLGVKCFELTMAYETEGIYLTHATPTTDEEGKQQVGYTFTIKNTCNTSATYQVNLEEKKLAEDIKRLSDDYIRVSLNDSKGKNLNTYENVETTIREEDFTSDVSHKLTSGSLGPNEEETYTLKLWMDEETPRIDAVMNATFESKISIIATYIEDGKRNNTITIRYQEPSYYSNISETITFTVSSENKDADIIEYSLDGTSYNTLDEPSQIVILPLEFTEEKEYTIYFRDSLGNTQSQTFTPTKLDKIGPEITVNNQKDDTWTNEKVIITIKAEDHLNEIDQMMYSTDKTEWTNLEMVKEEKVANAILELDQDQEQTYYIKATDVVGNESEVQETIVKIDTQGPDIKSFNANNEWEITKILTGIVEDTLSGIKGYEISTSPEPSGQWINVENAPTTEQIFTKEVHENTTYYLHVIDGTGNISTEEVVVNMIDTEDPKVELTIKESQKGLEDWYKSLTVRVTATDSQSGIASGAYCFGQEEECDPQTSFVVEEDGTYDIPFENNAEAQKLCVSVTDGANRTTKVCDEPYKVDGEAPIAHIKSATVDKDNIIIDATTSTDEHSQIASYTFKLSNGISATSETGNYIFTKVFNGDYTVTVEVTDTAGNTSTVTSEPLKITAYHTVTYVDIEEGYTSSYPEYILDGSTFEMELKKPYPIGAKPFVNNEAVAYEYEQDTLVVNNVTGDLVIKTNYIQNVEDLVALSSRTTEGEHYENKTFYLERNLNFQDAKSYRNSERTDYEDFNRDEVHETLYNEVTTGPGFIPIGFDNGTNNIYFSGTFNGNNHKIENLLERKPDNMDAETNYIYGLFGIIQNSTIENLTLTGKIEIPDRGSDIENRARVGGIVGSSRGNVILSNLTNYAEVYASSGRDSVGGISGELFADSSVTITNCNNYGNVSNGNMTGGIIGSNNGTTIIDQCNNHGTITNKMGTGAMGGIAGNLGTGTEIRNSNNYGKLSTDDHISSEQKVGGIAGVVRTGRTIIENCHNEGEIVSNVTRSSFTLNAGGILGRATESVVAEVKNCSNSGNISGAKRGGGIVGQINSANATLKVEESYNTGTVSGNEAIGGILGLANNAGNVIIQNSHNEGNITGRELNNVSSLIGGIIGSLMDSTKVVNIESTYNQGEVTGMYTGGIIGRSSGSPTITITDSHNKGNITGEKDAGGLIGNSGTLTASSTVTIKGSYNKGTVDSKNDSSGGIVGYNPGTANIEFTYNQGEVIGGTFSGGFIGFGGNSAILTITDSHNEGNITGQKDAGGIIGNSGGSSTVTIKSSYNEGTIDSKNDSSGGMIGYANGTVNLESSYNNGDILTNRVGGGLIAYASKCNAIIDKSYNTGNLSCIHTDNFAGCGGILGRADEVGNSYILNSYNEGLITSEYLDNFDPTDSGIVGRTGTGSDKTSIINSYNIGKVSGKAPNGIVSQYGNTKTLNVNNVYNAGELLGNGYGVGYLNTDSGYSFLNTYYDDRASSASNQTGIGTSKPLNDIKSAAFVQELNDNMKTIILDDALSEYQLVSWKLGENGFPTLDY